VCILEHEKEKFRKDVFNFESIRPVIRGKRRFGRVSGCLAKTVIQLCRIVMKVYVTHVDGLPRGEFGFRADRARLSFRVGRARLCRERDTRLFSSHETLRNTNQIHVDGLFS
jgi:hypothetical protein